MNITCKAVRLQLPVIDHETALVEPLATHLGTCLVCQAEAARYRRLLRSLAGLSRELDRVPVGLAAAVEARLDGVRGAPADRVTGRAAKVAAAAGAAVAAAGTVVVVRWLRGRAAA